MNVSCGNCPAKYAINDEKVRGRKVRIMCKHCGTPIIVDGTGAQPSVVPAPSTKPTPAATPRPEQESTADKPAADKPYRAPSQTIMGLQPDTLAKTRAAMLSKQGATKTEQTKSPGLTMPRPGSDSAVKKKDPAKAETKPGLRLPRPGGGKFPLGTAARKAVTEPGPQAPLESTATQPTATPPVAEEPVAEEPAVAPLPAPSDAAPTTPFQPPPAEPEAEPWVVAVTEEDQRDMTTPQVVKAYASGLIDDETFIWRDGMPDWLTPFEIPEVEKALRADGFVPGGEQAAGTHQPVPAGQWTEPGADRRFQLATHDEPGFDDVTVAMSQEDILAAEADLDEAIAMARPTPAPPSPVPVAPPEPEPAPEQPAPLFPARQEQPAAARAQVHEEPQGPDLFEHAAQAGSEEEQAEAAAAQEQEDQAIEAALTGARNESSVLFSLDALVGDKGEKKPAPPARRREEEEALLMAPAPPAPVPMPNLSPTADPLAAIAAPGPPSSPVAAKAPPRVEEPPAEEPKKKGKGGLLAAIVIILAACGGAVFAHTRGIITIPQLNEFVPALAGPNASASAEVPAPASAEVAEPEPPEPDPEPSASAEPEAAAGAGGASQITPSRAGAAGTATVAGATGGTSQNDTSSTTSDTSDTDTETASRSTTTSTSSGTAQTQTEDESSGAAFDVGAAKAALASAAATAAATCKKPGGATGSGRVSLTFKPSGRATGAVVDGAFAGTPEGGCIARVFRGASVPPFSGTPKRVTKTVRIR